MNSNKGCQGILRWPYLCGRKARPNSFVLTVCPRQKSRDTFIQTVAFLILSRHTQQPLQRLFEPPPPSLSPSHRHRHPPRLRIPLIVSAAIVNAALKRHSSPACKRRDVDAFRNFSTDALGPAGFPGGGGPIGPALLHEAPQTSDSSSLSDRELLELCLDSGIRDFLRLPCSITDTWHCLAATAHREGTLRLVTTNHEGNLPGIAAGNWFGTGRPVLVHAPRVAADPVPHPRGRPQRSRLPSPCPGRIDA